MRQMQRVGATRTPLRPWRYVTQTALVCATLAIGACGTTATTKVAQLPKAATATTRTQPTATTAGAPGGPIILPYSFASNWQHPATNGPLAIGGFAFAPSAPLVGYACKSYTSMATTAYVPAAGGTIASAHSLALNVSPSAPHSGLPEFSSTTDGGDSWQSSRPAHILGDGPCNITIDPNDPNDVFVASGILNAKETNTLIRSRDGGATWSTLSNISVQGQQLYASHLALIGTRLIASGQGLCTTKIACGDTAPQAANLFVSDDGGMTWQQIGQKVAQPGEMLSSFVTVGDTLFIAIQTYVTGSTTASRPTLSVPLSGPTTTTHWRSADAGATWTRMDTVSLPLLTFARDERFAGSYYGLSAGSTSNPHDAPRFFLSNDTLSKVGMSWTEDSHLLDGSDPSGGTILGVPFYPGVSGAPTSDTLVLTQGETIISSTVFTDPKTGNSRPGGAFMLLGHAAPRLWQALAPPGVTAWQAAPHGRHGFRLWGITIGTATQPSSLVYVDVG